MRRRLPLGVRQEIRHCWRRWNDRAQKISFERTVGALRKQSFIGITQPIMPSDFYENKVRNITRGAALLNHSLVEANKNWSFWHRIGRPNTANGFLPGRNIVSGKLVALTGGGLCQLSSMVYHLALLGGLTVQERHAHSLDIYEENQRFTPLGADATVVWGFKDLRLHNPHPFQISFELKVEHNTLIGELITDADLTAHHVEFVRINLEKPWVCVNTMVNQHLHSTTIYEQKQGLQVIT
jgi:vancomycin resistance protein VanW